jgi:hypothetical protein
MSLILPKEKSKLGYLCNDIKNDGIIIKELNLAPKTYLYEYVDKKGNIKDHKDAVMKCKGIPQKCLNADMYSNYQDEDVKCEFSGLKKVHKSISKKQKDQGVEHFSIVNQTQIKTFMASEWEGFDLVDGSYVPQGYEL